MARALPQCDPGEVVELLRSGDVEALDRITACYGQRMVAVGRRMCGNPVDAEDVVQDALLSAGQRLDQYRGEGSVEGWLVRMVVNACHHMRRGRKNDPRLHDAEAVLASPDASPEELAARGEMLQALGRAVEDLDPRDRLILVLAEGEGWTGTEIAERLEMTSGSVRTRLSRARRRVREQLALPA